jgi:hypothetical protein
MSHIEEEFEKIEEENGWNFLFRVSFSYFLSNEIIKLIF